MFGEAFIANLSNRSIWLGWSTSLMLSTTTKRTATASILSPSASSTSPEVHLHGRPRTASEGHERRHGIRDRAGPEPVARQHSTIARHIYPLHRSRQQTAKSFECAGASCPALVVFLGICDRREVGKGTLLVVGHSLETLQAGLLVACLKRCAGLTALCEPPTQTMPERTLLGS